MRAPRPQLRPAPRGLRAEFGWSSLDSQQPPLLMKCPWTPLPGTGVHRCGLLPLQQEVSCLWTSESGHRRLLLIHGPGRRCGRASPSHLPRVQRALGDGSRGPWGESGSLTLPARISIALSSLARVLPCSLGFPPRLGGFLPSRFPTSSCRDGGQPRRQQNNTGIHKESAARGEGISGSGLGFTFCSSVTQFLCIVAEDERTFSAWPCCTGTDVVRSPEREGRKLRVVQCGGGGGRESGTQVGPLEDPSRRGSGDRAQASPALPPPPSPHGNAGGLL